MKMGPNPFFQDILNNKIRSIIEEAKRLKYLKHPLLKGKYREYGVGKLLLELLPQFYSIGSGIIQDCNGVQSKEIDLLIWSNILLPPLLFGNENGVYPIESVYYHFEIKSKLNNTELKKAIENVKALRNLNFLANYPPPIKGYPVSILFAYGSDLKKASSELERYKAYDSNWNSSPLFNCICIIGKGYYSFSSIEQNNKNNQWLFFKPSNDYYEVLSLIGGIINTLVRNHGPNYGHYILYPETEIEKAEIISC